eukprot:26906-Chlamydomonas_euryale.AAC.5
MPGHTPTLPWQMPRPLAPAEQSASMQTFLAHTRVCSVLSVPLLCIGDVVSYDGHERATRQDRRARAQLRPSPRPGAWARRRDRWLSRVVDGAGRRAKLQCKGGWAEGASIRIRPTLPTCRATSTVAVTVRGGNVETAC